MYRNQLMVLRVRSCKLGKAEIVIVGVAVKLLITQKKSTIVQIWREEGGVSKGANTIRKNSCSHPCNVNGRRTHGFLEDPGDDIASASVCTGFQIARIDASAATKQHKSEWTSGLTRAIGTLLRCTLLDKAFACVFEMKSVCS